MRTRRSTPTPAVSYLFLAFAGVLAAWMGCSASGSTHVTGGTGGATTGTGKGGAGGGSGGAGGGGSDGGVDSGPQCAANQKVCNGVCVGADDPMYGCDPTFCMPCPSFPNGTAACAGGACALGTCAMGFKNCDGKDANGCETDVDHDPMNCGGCGSPCVLAHATPTCNAGVCQVGTCDTGGWTDCSGADGGSPDGGAPSIGCTTNTNTDPGNCGGCGMACPGQQSCHSGTCGLVCGKGTADCDTNPTDCETMLGTTKNCAGCDDCTLPNATTQCTMPGGVNTCTITSCAAGWGNCDNIPGNGCETNTSTDPNHCGNCGNPPCASGPHSTPVCNIGTCGIVCDTGYADCNGNPADGCEVNLGNDPNNCNACGAACSQNHATETCVAGVCTIVTCASGYNDCNKSVNDGCEDNTQTDPNNCGTCGTLCKTKNGTPACNQGTCAVGSCNTGFSHCPSQAGTNCETATGTDTANCGSCNNVCSSNNGTPSCNNGTCSVACAPLFGDCNMNVGDGCETGLNTVAHCGSCSTSCSTLNGTPACKVNGTTATCGVAGCSTGYANCPADGTDCKTFVGGSDVTNCGSCGNTCGSDATNPSLHDSGACVGGSCTVGTCDSGWANCDGVVTNGCETPINTVANCGACGHACSTLHGTPACNNVAGAWTCQILSCDAGYSSCGTGTDCSINLNTDNANCGGCGVACNAGVCGGAAGHVTSAVCSGGHCAINSCLSPWQDTDLTCSDGCECQLSSVPTTCGPGAFSLGSFPVGGQPVSHTSNLFPATPNAAYYVATFTGNASTSFHPKITLTDPLGEFVMDVTTDCNAPITNCGDKANSDGITTWETSYSGVSPPADPASLTPGGVSNFAPITTGAGTLYIKVYRKGGVSNCNNAYTITVNG